MHYVFTLLVMTWVAITFVLLPEQIDLLSWVLQLAGVCALMGTAIATYGARKRPIRPLVVSAPERFALLGAGIALAVFAIAVIWNEVG